MSRDRPRVTDTIKANATLNQVANPGTGSTNLLLYTGTGPQEPTPTPTPTTCAPVTNNTDVAIADLATVPRRSRSLAAPATRRRPRRSSIPANGTWNLRVRDAAAADSGRIDSWTIEP